MTPRVRVTLERFDDDAAPLVLYTDDVDTAERLAELLEEPARVRSVGVQRETWSDDPGGPDAAETGGHDAGTET